MSELSPSAKAKIEEWVHGLSGTPTVEQAVKMVSDVSAAEITEFCDSFGASAGQLAIFFRMMVSVTEQAEANNDSDEEMKLVLSGQALERCKELSEMVLAHIDTSDTIVEMVDEGQLH